MQWARQKQRKLVSVNGEVIMRYLTCCLFILFLSFHGAYAMDADNSGSDLHALTEDSQQSDGILSNLQDIFVGARFSSEQLALLQPELRNCVKESSTLSPAQERENADAEKVVRELISMVDTDDVCVLTSFLETFMYNERFTMALKRAILVLGLSHALAGEKVCATCLFEYIQRTRPQSFPAVFGQRNLVLVLDLEDPCSDDIDDCWRGHDTIVVVDTQGVSDDAEGQLAREGFSKAVRRVEERGNHQLFVHGSCMFFVPKNIVPEFHTPAHFSCVPYWGADALPLAHTLGTILDQRYLWNIEIVGHGDDDNISRFSWNILLTVLHLMERVPVHALILKSCGPLQKILASEQFDYPIIIANSTGAARSQDFNLFDVDEYPSVTEHSLCELGKLPKSTFSSGMTLNDKERIFTAATFSVSPVGIPFIKPANSLTAQLLEGYNPETLSIAYTPATYSTQVASLVRDEPIAQRNNIQTCTVLLNALRIEPADLTLVWPLNMVSCSPERKHLFHNLVLKDVGGWNTIPDVDSNDESTTIRSFLWLFIHEADLSKPKTILVDHLVLQQENGDFYTLEHVLVRTSIDGDRAHHSMSWQVDDQSYTCEVTSPDSEPLMERLDHCVARRMNKKEASEYLREFDRERAYFVDK